MSRKLILLGVLSLFLAPGAALSLGLGDIRLNSHLNQPMNAEIALSIASPAELETLRVELAPSEVFRRYGLDRPSFYDDLEFRVRATGPASAVVQVSSRRPIVEPFLTFLVEARWAGGRLLREYTVLLDPPVFLPAPAPAPAPPPAVDAPQPAPPVRPAPSPAPVAAPTPVRTEFGPDFGPVQRNDTLWAIAQRVRPDPALTTNQVMVAVFRANPNAFDGNINRLRAGAILRVPSREEMFAVARSEANAEVRRHTEAWRPTVAAPVERRLELAPPTDAPRPPAPVSDPAAAPGELTEAVQQLRGELAETRRLMEIKDAEIAALQARLAELEAEPAAVEAPVVPIDRPVVPADVAPEVADPEVAPEPEAAPAPTPEPEVATPRPAPAPVAPAPTLMDRVFDTLGNLWLWLLLAVALVVAAVGVFLRKRRQEQRSIEEDLAETGKWGALDESGGRLAAAGASAAGGVAAAPVIQPRRSQAEDLETILVEETAPPPAASVEPVPMQVPAPEPEPRSDEDYQYPFEDTIAGETGINLDQSDPMAEADFHMAYGLYDQAAEIVKKAVDREPDRYDLRRKLIDICFVWGNAEEFLAQAKAVREMGGEEQVADWSKIAIMGRQICPGDSLFAAGETPSALDMDFGGEGIELPDLGEDTSASGEWLDFDVGESDQAAEPDERLEALGDTREQPGPRTTGRPIEQTAELDLEELGIDLDLGESGQHALQDLAEHAPDFLEDTSYEKTQRFEGLAEETGDEESHVGTVRLPEKPEQPAATGAEDDDDGGTLVMKTAGMEAPEDDPTHRGRGIGADQEEPTYSGLTAIQDGGDDDQTVLQQGRGDADETVLQQGRGTEETVLQEGGYTDDDAPTLTGVDSFGEAEEEDGDRTFITRFEAPDESPTTELGTIEEDLDMDLDEFTQVLESDRERLSARDDDATQLAEGVGRRGTDDDDATMMAPGLGPASRDDDATQMAPRPEPLPGSEYQEGDTREMPPPGQMNEVGTKLDLARAYIDMGDPEGARSILGEVVEEGSEAQREEARQLLESLD